MLGIELLRLTAGLAPSALAATALPSLALRFLLTCCCSRCCGSLPPSDATALWATFAVRTATSDDECRLGVAGEALRPLLRLMQLLSLLPQLPLPLPLAEGSLDAAAPAELVNAGDEDGKVFDAFPATAFLKDSPALLRAMRPAIGGVGADATLMGGDGVAFVFPPRKPRDGFCESMCAGTDAEATVAFFGGLVFAAGAPTPDCKLLLVSATAPPGAQGMLGAGPLATTAMCDATNGLVLGGCCGMEGGLVLAADCCSIVTAADAGEGAPCAAGTPLTANEGAGASIPPPIVDSIPVAAPTDGAGASIPMGGASCP
mmetsp:Transcript_6521/g.11381  ORF Transcript_6521/g.11381 Transcript_6521/m.11381 type:complete len:316 (-) Transcript_6521:223-1170(-)